MKKLLKLFNINKPSFILLVLPYIGFNLKEVYTSPFFSALSFSGLLCLLLIIELIFKLTYNKFTRVENLITAFVISGSFIFFYGVYIVTYLQSTLIYSIRGRVILTISIILIFLLIFIFNRYNKSYKIFNSFFIAFGFVTFLFNSSSSTEKIKNINSIQNSYIQLQKKPEYVKPVILIISDEYNSPDGLYNVFKDSSIYNFSNDLKKNNWVVSNSNFSYETSTIHSLSSLFNFNLSKDSTYSKQTISNIGTNKLVHALLFDSLTTKNVSIVNYGIFDIGKSIPISRLYFYPKNFIESFFIYSTLYYIIYNTGQFNKDGYENNYYPMESHNKNILNTINDSLNNSINKRQFIYIHLYMPHGPIIFEPEFHNRNENNMSNYFAYWNFTNNKLSTLLKRLTSENKFRIILTGDHGFRSDKRVNPHYTFTAFYGFNNYDLEKIESVQDLGSLINGSF
ncbi:MAG: sulfatase-like hydrolase/transferase [Bacteroidetes bacterium]|nr:sulfatase-like hydrolase/transferase [Bacteroidota bacterium]